MMSSQNSKILKFGSAIVVIVLALGYLAYTGVQESKSYYVTIKELRGMGDGAYSKRLRVAGNVLPGSIKRSGTNLNFALTENDQVLNVGVSEAEKKLAAKAEALAGPVVTRPRPRPDTIKGQTQKILTGYGPLYVTINEDDKGLFELFAQIGRGGGYTASFSEGIGRLVSLCLRSGVPVDEIIDQLEGIRSPRLAIDHGERIYSIPDAIAKAIKRHIGMQKTGVMAPIDSYDAETGAVHVDDELEKESHPDELVKRGLNPECPECGRTLVLEEGCAKCRHCGYSEC